MPDDDKKKPAGKEQPDEKPKEPEATALSPEALERLRARLARKYH